MRRLVTAVLLAGACPVAPAFADTQPELALVTIEARAGYGATLGGGAGTTSLRSSPITFSALADFAIRTEPRISGYAGLVAELGDRGAAGALAGVRARPGSGAIRLAAGGVYIAVPYNLAGAAVGLGGCKGIGVAAVCLDFEATVFVAGSDLPEGRVATQLQAVLGLGFDVL